MRLRRTGIFAALALTATSLSQAFEVPKFEPNTVDTAQVLTNQEVAAINARIGDLRSSGILAAVLVVPSLEGDSIEEVAEKTFRTWKLGKKGVDNGLLFVFALNDRKFRIEVGNGLEGDITDLHAMRILNFVIMPEFKKQSYATGILRGLEVAQKLKQKSMGESDFTALVTTDKPTKDWNRGSRAWLYWILIVFLGAPAMHAYRANIFDFRFLIKNLLIKIFLALNPGVFILFLFASISLSDLGALAIKNLIEFKGSIAKNTPYWFFFALYCFLISPLVRIVCFYFGKAIGRNENKYCRSRYEIYQRSPIKYLLGFNPSALFIKTLITLAVFIALALSTETWHFVAISASEISLVIFAFVGKVNFELLPLLSENRAKRALAAERFDRIMSRHKGKVLLFGKSYDLTPRSSSTSRFSSSSSSSSSSSGGGRSSGGGASSGW